MELDESNNVYYLLYMLPFFFDKETIDQKIEQVFELFSEHPVESAFVVFPIVSYLSRQDSSVVLKFKNERKEMFQIFQNTCKSILLDAGNMLEKKKKMFRSTTIQYVSELNGYNAQDFFTVLNVASAYSPKQQTNHILFSNTKGILNILKAFMLNDSETESDPSKDKRSSISSGM